MVVIKLLGGMANQMAQRAYGIALESRGYDVAFDKSVLIEGTHREYSLKEFSDLRFAAPTKNFVYEGTSLKFNPSLLNPPDGSTIIGYFQSERYLQGIEDKVRQTFTFRTPLSSYTTNLKRDIENSNSVFLHVRRKDYVQHQDFHGLPTVEYYRKGLKYIHERRPFDRKIFIFSDDRDWCRENLPKDFTVVDGTNKYEDMQLMMSCKDAVIANSSYSWFGAWLTDRPGKIVVAPHPWFQANIQEEIVPDRWVKIDF